MSEEFALLFRIQTEGIDALDKMGASTKAVSLETKYSSAELQQFSTMLSIVTRSGDTYRKALEDIAKSAKTAGAATAGIARDLLELDKAQQRSAAEAEKAAARKEAADEKYWQAFQKRADAEARAFVARRKREQEEAAAAAASSPLDGFGKGAALGAFGLGAVGGVGMQLGRQAIEELKNALLSLTVGYTSAAHETVNFAERLDISAGQARKLQNEASIAGVSVERLASSARIVATALEDGEGSGKKAAAAFARMGIDTHDAFGQIREAGPITLELIDKLSMITSETERTREGNAALGRGYKEIVPLVEQLRELSGVSRELGVNLQTNVVEEAAKADEKFRELALSFDLVRNTLAQKLLPIVIPIVESVTRLVSGQPEGAVESAASWGLGFAKAAVSRPFKMIESGYDLARGAAALPGLLSGEAGKDNASPGDLYNASKNAIAGGPGMQLDAAMKATNRRKNAALESSLEENDLPGRARKAKTEYEKSLTTLRGAGENATDADREAVTSAKLRSDALEAQLKETKEAGKTAKEQLAELKRITREGESLSGRGESGQQRIVASMATMLKSPEFLALPPVMQASGRASIVASAAEGLAREDKKKEDDTAKKLQEHQDKAIALSETFANRENRDLVGTKGEAYSGPAGGVIQMLDGLTGISRSGLKGDALSALPSIPRQATSQDLLKETTDDEKRQTKLLEVNSRPGQELATRKAISDLRVKTSQDVLALELNIIASTLSGAKAQQEVENATLKQAQAVKDIHEEDALRQAETNKQNAAEARSLATSLTEASFSGSKGVRGFFAGQGRSLAGQVAGNVAGPLIDTGLNAVKSNIPTDGPIGKAASTVFAGTIFDPSKKGTGIDANTAIIKTQIETTKAQIDAQNANTEALGGKPTAGSPSSGTPIGVFGTGGTAAAGILGATGLPPALTSAIGRVISGSGTAASSLSSLFASAPSGTMDTSAAAQYGSIASGGTTSGTPVDIGSLGSQASVSSTTSASTFTKDAAAVGMIAGGAIAAVKGFSQGGARGALEGTAGVLGGAAGIADLIPGGQVVGAVLGIASMVTGMVGGLLGDPRALRAKAITNELGQNQYQAPVAWNVTEGPGGTYSDIDARGNLRSSTMSAVPTVAEPYETTAVIGGQRNYYAVPGQVTAPYSGGATGTGVTPTAGAPAPAPSMTVYAMDSQSFNDFAQKNHMAIGEAMATHLQNHEGRASAAIRNV
jgi:hypothetical protein